MTKDQSNKTYETALNQYRGEIDNIDEKILQLLKERMQIVAKVRKIKHDNGEKFFIKSAREADMIKNLVAKAGGALPKSTIVNIWRKLITSSNMVEQPIRVALHNPNKISDYNYLLREYYADFVPITNHDSVNNVVLEIEKNNSQIAVFALPNNVSENNFDDIGEDWWINIANNKAGLKVFAKIPTIAYSEQERQAGGALELVAMAIKKPEKSLDDNSLFCIELANSVAKSQLLSAFSDNKINAKILKSTKLKQVDEITFYLVEASGFFDENSTEIKAFTKSKIKPFVKILGVYPTAV
jgi:chorismate mutase